MTWRHQFSLRPSNFAWTSDVEGPSTAVSISFLTSTCCKIVSHLKVAGYVYFRFKMKWPEVSSKTVHGSKLFCKSGIHPEKRFNFHLYTFPTTGSTSGLKLSASWTRLKVARSSIYPEIRVCSVKYKVLLLQLIFFVVRDFCLHGESKFRSDRSFLEKKPLITSLLNQKRQ